MKTTELKEKVIRKIFSIEDEILLKEVSKLIGVSNEEEIYHLSDEQLKAVEEAQEQYRRGEFISGEEADKEIREWLGE
jgi:hypothetical protein